jgi:hypothetical protein
MRGVLAGVYKAARIFYNKTIVEPGDPTFYPIAGRGDKDSEILSENDFLRRELAGQHECRLANTWAAPARG